MSSHPTAPKLAFWLRAKPRCYSGLQSSEGPVPCFPWPQPLVTMLLAHGHPAVLQTQQALPRFRPFTCDALSPHTCIAHFSLPLGIFPPNVPSNETFPHHPTEAHTCTDTCKNADTQMHTSPVPSTLLYVSPLHIIPLDIPLVYLFLCMFSRIKLRDSRDFICVSLPLWLQHLQQNLFYHFSVVTC